MRILIAGGNGEVGKDISNFLSKRFKIIVGSRSQKNLNKKNIIFKKIDFSKKISLNENIDLIINCIATHNYSKKKNFDDYYKSNILTILNLIKFAEKRNIKIINFSTISIYNSNPKNQTEEDDIEIANNMLATTKYIGEKLLEISNIETINLRLPGVLTQNKIASRPWLRTVISAIKEKKKIKAFNLEKKFNSLIDTKEIQDFIVHIIQGKFISGNYNFMSNNPLKLERILAIITKVLKSDSKVIDCGSRKTLFINNKKIFKKFKYKISSVEKIILRNLND